MNNKNFKFLDPGELIENELELKLAKTVEADAVKKYVPAYEFDMINSETGEKMGEIRLRVGHNENIQYGGNMGYEVIKKFRGNRYASRSCKLLFPFIRKHGVSEFLITCDPGNIASKRTCEIVGGEFVEVADVPEYNETYQRGEKKKCIYKFNI